MAINPFDQFDQPANAFDQFDDQPEKAKPASAMRKLGDLGLGVAGGVVGITKALADSAGANNKASQVLGSINEGIGDYLSPSAKADQQAISAGMADASAKGFNLEGVKAGAKAFATAPGQFVAQAAGSALPFIAASVATGGTATPAMLGVLAGAGTAKGTIYDRIKKEGGTEEQASKAQEYGGPNTDQIALGGALGVADALTGVASSGTRIIRNALGKPIAQAVTNGAEVGVLKRAGMGMLKEMPLEAAQGGQEQVAANLAAQRAGYEAGTWDNVASNATLEALASAGPGAAFGALDTQTKQTPPPVVPPVTPPAIDQLSGLPPTAPVTPTAPTAPGMGFNPDAGQMTQFPDGSQSFTSEVPPVAPIKPSEAMGINPTAGPISAAAALSVDSGVTQEIQINEANAADQAAYEQATQAQAQQAAEQDTADKPITTGKLAEAQLSEDDKRAILFSNKAVADGGIQYEGTQDGDILNGQGQPYSTRFAAARRARMEGKDWTIATVFDGYVARRKDANVEPDAVQPSDTGSLGAGSPDSAPSLVPGLVAADELGAQQSRLAAPDVGQPGELPGGVADAPLNGDFQTEAANVQNPAPAAIQPEARVAPDQDAGEAPQDVAGSTAAPAGVPTAGSVAVEGGGVAVASFAKPLQAQAFIGKNKLKDTHQSVKTATGWDVVPKNSQPQESTNAQAPEAIQSESVQEEAPRADLTDAQRAQVNDANAQDFEALYQADIKDGIKRRLGKLKPNEADQKKTPFKSFLREYGIAPAHTSDIAGSNRMRANNVLPATFRANGLGLDALVERAIERGFMTEADRGDQGKLIAMIQSEIAGEQQISSEFATEDAAAQTERVQRREIEGMADGLGLPYDADISTDRLASMVARIDDRLKDEPRGTTKAQRIIARAKETVARIERKRAKYEAELAGFAAFTIAEQDALIDVMADADGNPLFVKVADIQAEQAWAQTNGTWSDQNEQANRGATGNSQEAGAPVAGVAPARAGDGNQAGPQEQPGSPEAQAGQSEGLTAPTRADVLAQQEAVEQAEKAKAKADKDAEAKAKADGIAKEIAARQEASADNFQLGQSAEDSLAGQGSVFDEPTAPISKTGTTAAPVNPPASDAEVISRTVERFDRLGVKGVERKKSVIETLASQWGMTSDEVADMPEVQSALRKSPAKASKTAATERFVQGVMQQGLDAVAAERGEANPVQPAAESKPAKIEDSGEVLEGARKLYAKNYAAKLDEGAGMDTAAVPLSKSWPEPDYQRLIDEGADPWAVAMARAMRDEVPTKPSSSWKLKGWVQKVEALRDMTAKVMSGEMTKEKFKTTGGQFNLADWFNKIDLYEAVGHANSLKGLTFGRHEYGMYAGQTFNPAKVLWTINMPSKSASATWSNGNWGNDLAVADTKAEAIEKFKAWSAAQVEAPPVAAKATSFDIYSYRSKPNVFIVGKRISSAKSVDLKEFPTAKEARAYVAANQAELERLLAEAKFEPSERGESNAPRVGADHRNGADVTTDQFRDTFGFRGEQFGASMPQGERQANMNQAYDALMDLAGVIGIPPKALSLNGELGLAFGARGVGGKNPAAAHYERDTTGAVTPNRVVINLTRKNGAGSLAHEWFHAVDNYFARMRGEKAGMLTESYASRGEGVRPEMVMAFKQLVTTIQLSGMRERSKQLDKKRVKDYWSTGLEMAARSFESYVIAKLQDKNGSNDYLANIVPEELYAMQGSYPYPVMGEMPAIRAAFDNFFDVVQTKETEQGVAMFSRGKSGVLSANGKFKGWPKFNTWTRQEYSDVVSLLPEAYRGDPHRVEPVATKDWDALAATVLPELEALNEVSGEGTFRLDALGNILVDERKSGRDAVVEDALPIAEKHGLGVFVTGVRTESISYYADAGFVSEMGLGAVLARATGSNAPVVPMASGTVNNPAYGTMMSYKPRGFPMPMFTRGGASTSGLPTTQVSSITSAIRARWGNAPEVIVVANMADPLIPQAVRDYDQAQKSQGATGEPEGFVYKGKVYLVADQLVTPTDVMRVLFHESLGHLGLRGVFGDKLNPILKQLAAMRRGEVAAKAAQYGLDMNTEKGRLEAAEEVLAEMAQTKPEMGFVKRAIALIRGWLRANVPSFNNMKMNDSDIIANFILPARAYIEGKGGKESRDVIFSDARNETKFQSSAGKSWKFDRFAAAGREAGSPQVAMADAVALTGIDLGLAVEISQELGADVPMAFDHASDTVLVNAKFANFPRGEMAQWMAEEILHALDSIRPSRMLSASATSFDLNSGVVATEAMRHFSEGGKLANWLTYPLADDTMTQSQVKAELFARLGVIYFGQPELLKREFPTAYKAYHDTFGLGAIERAQQKDTARDLSAKVFRASGAVDNPQAGIQYGQRAGVAQPGKRSGEARSADPRLERLYSELRRNFGASAGGGLVQFARSNTSPSRAPSQAKTDGANPDIRFSRTVGRNSWDAPEASQFDDLVYKLQDKQIDTKRVVEAIKAKAGALADEKNVYLQEELFHGRAAARTEDFVNKELGPLMSMMKMFSIDIPMLDEYLHARHAEEANKLIAERNPEILDGGSGMTTQAARDYLAKLTKAERNKLETAAAKVDGILASTRQLYADYDLESQDKVDGWGTMFKHYVPLMREDKDGGMGIGQGFSIKGKEVKGRTGSTRKVVDILANIALQRERAIVRGEKNRVATALVGLVKLNPNKDFWQVGPPPAQKVYDPASNSVVERQDPLYKSRDNVVVAKVKGKDGNVTEQAVTFNEDDARAVRMAASLKNLDASQLEGLLGVSAKITRYFAAINTQFNPIFGTVNLVRDVQGALFNLTSTPLKGKALAIAGHTMSALKGIYLDARAARDGVAPTSKWAALWEEFQAEGGQTGFRDLFANSADRAKAIERELNPTAWMDSPLGQVFTANGTLKVPLTVAQKKATGMFGWLSDYNLAMENAVRLAAYKVALEQGISKQQSASLGKNLTVNFNRKGQVGQQAGALYAFFNASMQGTARLGQTLFDMEPGKPKTLRLSATGKRIVVGGVLLGSMQAFLLAAAGFDDEEPPDFVRERSLIIPTGGKTYITIPMPLGLHVLPNMGRIPTEFAMGGFKDPVQHIAKMLGLFAGSFNPIGGGASLVQMLAPTAIDPMVAIAENKDWTGKPIAKTSFNKATPGHELTKDTASAPAKLLAEAINYLSGGTEYTAGLLSPTPDQIDYLFGQVTGGVGREASKVLQTGGAIYSGEDLPIHKVPLVGRFYGDTDTQSAQSGKFYSAINKLNVHEAEIKGLRKDGRGDEAAQYLQENPEARLFMAANAAERDVQKMRAIKRDLVADGASSEEVKRIEERISERMMRFNLTMERLREQEAA